MHVNEYGGSKDCCVAEHVFDQFGGGSVAPYSVNAPVSVNVDNNG